MYISPHAPFRGASTEKIKKIGFSVIMENRYLPPNTHIIIIILKNTSCFITQLTTKKISHNHATGVHAREKPALKCTIFSHHKLLLFYRRIGIIIMGIVRLLAATIKIKYHWKSESIRKKGFFGFCH